MTTKPDKVKQLQDKCQSVLNELLRDDDNKYCVDCDSKGEFKYRRLDGSCLPNRTFHQ